MQKEARRCRKRHGGAERGTEEHVVSKNIQVVKKTSICFICCLHVCNDVLWYAIGSQSIIENMLVHIEHWNLTQSMHFIHSELPTGSHGRWPSHVRTLWNSLLSDNINETSIGPKVQWTRGLGFQGSKGSRIQRCLCNIVKCSMQSRDQYYEVLVHNII